MFKNKYNGKWIETNSKKIGLPFTYENLEMLLIKIVSNEPKTFTHEDF